MTTIEDVTRLCDVCGKPSTQTEYTSFSFGSGGADLDGRMHDLPGMSIEECPHCGYCAGSIGRYGRLKKEIEETEELSEGDKLQRDEGSTGEVQKEQKSGIEEIDAALERIRSITKEAEYRQIEKDDDMSDYAKRLYKNAYVLEKLGDIEDVGFAYRALAWAAGDHRLFIKKAVDYLKRYFVHSGHAEKIDKEKIHITNEEYAHWRIFFADMFRKAGLFAEAAEQIEAGLDEKPKEEYKKALKFEKYLVDIQSTATYAFDDVKDLEAIKYVNKAKDEGRLTALLEHQDYSVRKRALLEILKDKNEEIIPLLLKLLTDPSLYIRYKAHQALKEINPNWTELPETKETVPLLISKLRHGSLSMKYSMAKYLTEIGDKRAEDALIECLVDLHRQLRDDDNYTHNEYRNEVNNIIYTEPEFSGLEAGVIYAEEKGGEDIRTRLIRALARLGSQRGLKEIINIYNSINHERHFALRLEIARAAANIKGPLAIKFLNDFADEITGGSDDFKLEDLGSFEADMLTHIGRGLLEMKQERGEKILRRLVHKEPLSAAVLYKCGVKPAIGDLLYKVDLSGVHSTEERTEIIKFVPELEEYTSLKSAYEPYSDCYEFSNTVESIFETYQTGEAFKELAAMLSSCRGEKRAALIYSIMIFNEEIFDNLLHKYSKEIKDAFELTDYDDPEYWKYNNTFYAISQNYKKNKTADELDIPPSKYWDKKSVAEVYNKADSYTKKFLDIIGKYQDDESVEVRLQISLARAAKGDTDETEKIIDIFKSFPKRKKVSTITQAYRRKIAGLHKFLKFASESTDEIISLYAKRMIEIAKDEEESPL